MRTTRGGDPVVNQYAEIDRLIAFHASIPELHHRLPFLRAVRAGLLMTCEIHRGGLPDQRELVRIGKKRAVMLLIGDDDYQSSGPSGWSALRFRQWRPVKVIVHATGGTEAISQELVTGALALRRTVLIETDQAHAVAWREWGQALEPPYGVLTLLPEDQHPIPETAH